MCLVSHHPETVCVPGSSIWILSGDTDDKHTCDCRSLLEKACRGIKSCRGGDGGRREWVFLNQIEENAENWKWVRTRAGRTRRASKVGKRLNCSENAKPCEGTEGNGINNSSRYWAGPSGKQTPPEAAPHFLSGARSRSLWPPACPADYYLLSTPGNRQCLCLCTRQLAYSQHS